MKEISANIQQGKYEDVLSSVQSPVISLTELIKNAADSSQNNDEPITIDIDTRNNIISIIDYGEGMTEKEIEDLGKAAYSGKMIDDQIQSPIGNPLSGSKGLGLLTAFFIADILEIETYSVKDDKTYYLIWNKGDQSYRYREIDSEFKGTIVTLKNIVPDKLQMILLPEEKVKLYMSSINFFNNNSNLLKIKLIIDGIEESYYPSLSIEEFYSQNRRANNGFVAKASFNYKDNRIKLSYEDNVSNFYNFSDKEIIFSDKSSVERFINEINAPEKVAPIKSICDSIVFSEQFINVEVPEFSGTFYTWRGRKSEELDAWPVGVRIYVNNYSLYKYLDKENDWLLLSEISQNLKATNYKLKNTFGYLDMTNYNENNEALKISKERNDFIDSLPQRKFIQIMRDIVAGTFSRIDIATKNPPVESFSLRYSNVTLRIGETFDLKSAVTRNNLDLGKINLDFNASEISISEDWIVSSNKKGKNEIKLSYNDRMYSFTVIYKSVIPEFDLKKKNETIYKGNTINLRDYILPSSCKDVTVDSILIENENRNTIITKDLFDKNNSIGTHIIYYKYDDFQRVLTITVKEVVPKPGSGIKAPKINMLFPNLNSLRENSFKIPELIDSISSYYIQAPTLCMAAIRILIESSGKAFFQFIMEEETEEKLPSLINRILNLRDCNHRNPDYSKIVEKREQGFINEFQRISSEYQLELSKDVKKNINSHLSDLNLNSFVHNPNVIATDTTVYRSMQIFSPLLNYIFDVLLISENN